MKHVHLSTGTKFILLIFYTSTLAMPFPILLEVSNVLLTACLLCGNIWWKAGIKVVTAFLVLSAIYYLTRDQSGVAQVFHTWALLIRRLIVPFGTGYYFIDSTNVSSLMASMEKVRLPKAMIIPLLVMFRYIPVLRGEYRKIKEAMKIRGIEPGLQSFRTPSLSLEYLLVPLLFSTFNIGEELSQAAFGKGISIEGKKNRFFETKFGVCDALIFIYLTVSVFVSIRG